MKRLITWLFMLMALAPAAYAGTPTINFNVSSPSSQALTVPWGQNTISWSQLQSIFTSNPGFSQYNIQFPNGASWGVMPGQMQALYSSYTQQARALGYSITNTPDMMFSSLQSTVSNGMIPINNMTSGMQQQINAALLELRYRELNLSDSLPDWLKSAILWVWNALVAGAGYIYDNCWAGWDYVRQTLKEIF